MKKIISFHEKNLIQLHFHRRKVLCLIRILTPDICCIDVSSGSYNARIPLRKLAMRPAQWSSFSRIVPAGGDFPGMSFARDGCRQAALPHVHEVSA